MWYNKSWSRIILVLVVIGLVILGYYYWKQSSQQTINELFQQTPANLPDYQEYLVGGQLPDIPASTNAITLDASSSILAVASSGDATISLYDINRLSQLFKFNTGDTYIYKLLFSQVDNTILYVLVKQSVLAYVKIIKLNYTSQSFITLKSIYVSTIVNNIQVSPLDAKYLVYYTSGSVYLMNLADYTTKNFKFANPFNMSISKDNNNVFISGITPTATDKSLLVTNPFTPQQLAIPDILNNAIFKSTFSNDSKYILASSLVNSKYYIQKHAIQDLITTNTTPVYSIPTTAYSSSLDINSSDKLCVWNSVSSTNLTIADFVTGTQLTTLTIPLCTDVNNPYIVGFTSKYLYSACVANIVLWKDISDRLPLATTSTQPLATTSTFPLTTTSTFPLTTTSTQPLATTSTQPLTTTSTQPLTTTSTQPLTTTSTQSPETTEYIENKEIPVPQLARNSNPMSTIYKALISNQLANTENMPAPTERTALGQGRLPRVS